MEVNRILKKVVPIILIATLIICSCREQVALKLSGEGAFKYWSTSQKNEDGLPLYYYFDKKGRFLIFGKWYDSGFLLTYSSPLGSKGWYMINADSVYIKNQVYSIKQLSSNSVQLQSGTVSDTLYAVEKGMIPSNFDMQWVIEGQEYDFKDLSDE